jgi:hypothetical protein
MKPSDIKELQHGDKIFWEDPENLRSRILTVKKVRVKSYNDIVIHSQEGDVLYCTSSQIRKV